VAEEYEQTWQRPGELRGSLERTRRDNLSDNAETQVQVFHHRVGSQPPGRYKVRSWCPGRNDHEPATERTESVSDTRGRAQGLCHPVCVRSRENSTMIELAEYV